MKKASTTGTASTGDTPHEDAMERFRQWGLQSRARSLEQKEMHTIRGTNAGDWTGFSVAISSDGLTIIIGSPLSDDHVADPTDTSKSGKDMGHVEIWRWINLSDQEGEWTQIGQMIPGEMANDWFGSSVDISGDGNTISVGALGSDDAAGQVRLFRYDDSDVDTIGRTWSQVWHIAGRMAHDWCGWSVALSDDGRTVATGGPKNGMMGDMAGHVQVYRQNTDAIESWIQMGEDLLGNAAMEEFGTSVDLSSDGSVLAVGANQPVGGGAGLVRVFNLDDSDSWLQMGNDVMGEVSGERFGSSVSLSSNGLTLAVGAPYNAQPYAKVFEFRNDADASWTLVGSKINGNEDDADDQRFGSSVSLTSDGDMVAIGGPSFSSMGVARMFQFMQNIDVNGTGTSAWMPMGEDFISNHTMDNFGDAIALSGDGDTIAIGAPYIVDYTEFAGEVGIIQGIDPLLNPSPAPSFISPQRRPRGPNEDVGEDIGGGVNMVPMIISGAFAATLMFCCGYAVRRDKVREEEEKQDSSESNNDYDPLNTSGSGGAPSPMAVVGPMVDQNQDQPEPSSLSESELGVNANIFQGTDVIGLGVGVGADADAEADAGLTFPLKTASHSMIQGSWTEEGRQESLGHGSWSKEGGMKLDS